jgi:nucleoid-associated protein YgaU
LIYGVDAASIAALNGISNYDMIYFNQALAIP